MNGNDEQHYVSRREFGELREQVQETRTQIAVLETMVRELLQRYHSLPTWLTIAVGMGLSVTGIVVTLVLSGRL